jgi:tRNA threonylcarbamoyladenosine biosynthesis protein TsaB
LPESREKKLTSLLAFDTSTEQMSIGLAVDDQVWLSDSAGGAVASSALLPTVAALLARAGVTLSNLDAIAFGQGPGAFTGLRTACSVAQGLAFGISRPLIALDSLRAAAEDARRGAQTFDVWTVMDARMGEIYAARYRFAAGQWQTIQRPGLTVAEDLNVLWADDPPRHVAGSALNAFADRLRHGGASLHPDALPRAQALLTLAATSWAHGQSLLPEAALPTYVRDKVARTTAERATAPLRIAGSTPD